MRVSTSQIFGTGTANLLRGQSSLYKLQNQLSTGRRSLTPADDPVGASEALKVSQSLSVNKQFLDNQSNAAGQLALVGEHLSSLTDLITTVRESAVQAGNGGLSDADRGVISAEIKQRYDELVGLANSTDSNGNYLFAGYKSSTQPFTFTGVPGSRVVTYNGDDGQRMLQVDTDRQIAVSHPGSDLFMRNSRGNGTFVAGAGAANTGTGVVSKGSVVNAYDGNKYAITFDTPPSTYSVTATAPDGTTTTVGTALPFTPGGNIVLGQTGQQIQVSITGTPAANDTFNVAPSTNQEDIFSTLDQFIKFLDTPNAANGTGLNSPSNQLGGVIANLDHALDNVLKIQTDIGARQHALDSLTTLGQDVDVQYQGDLAKLQDLDYTQAISDMTKEQMALQAAQLSFKQTSQLSLFNIL